MPFAAANPSSFGDAASAPRIPAFLPFITVPQLQVLHAQAAEGFRSPVRVIDASWHMPAAKRNAAAEYAQGHIPGAVFWSLDDYSDTQSPYPHMLPKPADFAAFMGKLGITQTDTVVIYDTAGIFSAPRLWWMLRVMGHAGDVFVLQGGRDAWEDAGYALSNVPAIPEEEEYRTDMQHSLLADVAAVLRATTDPDMQIVDARGTARFAGAEAEPRPGVEAGHMPSAINVHYAALLEGAPAQFKSPSALANVFNAAGVDIKRPIITSCGSGVTACILAAALHALGATKVAVYDGSWSEWGSRPDLPKEKS